MDVQGLSIDNIEWDMQRFSDCCGQGRNLALLAMVERLKGESHPMFFEILVPLETETLNAANTVCGLAVLPGGTVTHSV